MSNPRHSSSSENWITPPWITAYARKVLGGIDLDPASSAKANKVVQAGHYFTKSQDGLSRIWRLNSYHKHTVSVWLNPPGGKTDDGKSKLKLWWIKMLEQRGGPYFRHGLFLSFSIEACQTTQLECKYPLLAFPTCFFKRRVGFIDALTGEVVKGNTHSSCLTYVPGAINESKLFAFIFQRYGKIVKPARREIITK